MAANARRRTLSLSAAIIAVVIALAAGFAGGWFVRTATTTTTTTTSTTTTTTTSTTTTTTTTVAPAARCTGSVLSGRVVTSSGAAGTIEVTFQATNTSASKCTVRGFPTLQLLSANATALTTATVNGAATFSVAAANAAPTLQTLTPGGHVSFLAQYSDVPVGTQTSCPSAASVNVYPPLSGTAFNVVASLSPCGLGTVHVSPFFAAS